jgi:UDP-N-acetylglucosamine acyltransferase
MIGGMSGVEHDVMPYGVVMGQRANLAGLNIIGLKRAKFSRDKIHSLRSFYKELFENSDNNLHDTISRLELDSKYKDKELVQNVMKFFKIESSRAILKPKP